MELAVACYAVTKPFPPGEAYGLTSQIRRSSTSIAANIAEGHGRENTGSFIQFLRMAQGSLNPPYSPNPAPLAALGGFAARDVLYLGL